MYDWYKQGSFSHPSSAASSSRASSPLSDASLSHHVADYLALGSHDASYAHADPTFVTLPSPDSNTLLNLGSSSSAYLSSSHHSTAADMAPLPSPPHSAQESAHTFTRPLLPDESDKLSTLEKLRLFLATAPLRWSSSSSYDDHDMEPSTQLPTPPKAPASHPSMKRFALPYPVGEHISCVLWAGKYFITGTDIVRALVFRFDAFGRPVRNMKKFEEGVFSDLRNLKPGIDASLEEPKSPFLDLLFKYQCIRTQKKQKVFFWESVPHDRLFLDALERDLKREKAGLEPTSAVAGEPALSFTYDPSRSLYEQYSSSNKPSRTGESSAGSGMEKRRASSDRGDSRASPVPAGVLAGQQQLSATPGVPGGSHGLGLGHTGSPPRASHHVQPQTAAGGTPSRDASSAQSGIASSILQSYVFDGNPTYKQRRKRPNPPPPHFAASRAQALALGQGQGFTDLPSRTGDALSDGPGSAGANASFAIGGARQSSFSSLSSPSSSHAFDMGIGYGPADRSMSAADMFVSQARGEQDADVRRTRARVAQAQREAFARAGEMGYSGAQIVAGSPSAAEASGPDSRASSAASMSMSMPAGIASGETTGKAYVCPVFSCGRLFRHPKCVQRHVVARSAADAAHALVGGDMGESVGHQQGMAVSGVFRDVLGDEEGLLVAVGDSRQQQLQRPATAPTSTSASASASVDGEYASGYPMAGLLSGTGAGTQPEFAYTLGGMDMEMDGLTGAGLDMDMSMSMPAAAFEASTTTSPPFAPASAPASTGTAGAGPVRRHRSITPSLMHAHPHPRHHTHPHPHSASPSPRGFHPYASVPHSRIGSNHSSPRGLGAAATMPRVLAAQASLASSTSASASFDSLFGGFDGFTSASASVPSLDLGAVGDYMAHTPAHGHGQASYAASAMMGSSGGSLGMSGSASAPSVALGSPFSTTTAMGMDGGEWPWAPSMSPYGAVSAGIFSGVPA